MPGIASLLPQRPYVTRAPTKVQVDAQCNRPYNKSTSADAAARACGRQHACFVHGQQHPDASAACFPRHDLYRRYEADCNVKGTRAASCMPAACHAAMQMPGCHAPEGTAPSHEAVDMPGSPHAIALAAMELLDAATWQLLPALHNTEEQIHRICLTSRGTTVSQQLHSFLSVATELRYLASGSILLLQNLGSCEENCHQQEQEQQQGQAEQQQQQHPTEQQHYHQGQTEQQQKNSYQQQEKQQQKAVCQEALKACARLLVSVGSAEQRVLGSAAVYAAVLREAQQVQQHKAAPVPVAAAATTGSMGAAWHLQQGEEERQQAQQGARGRSVQMAQERQPEQQQEQQQQWQEQEQGQQQHKAMLQSLLVRLRQEGYHPDEGGASFSVALSREEKQQHLADLRQQERGLLAAVHDVLHSPEACPDVELTAEELRQDVLLAALVVQQQYKQKQKPIHQQQRADYDDGDYGTSTSAKGQEGEHLGIGADVMESVPGHDEHWQEVHGEDAVTCLQLDLATAQKLLRLHPDRNIRQQVYEQAVQKRCLAVLDGMEQLAAVRRSIALCHDLPCYADLAHMGTLAGSPSTATAFLLELAEAVRPAAAQKVAQWQQQQQQLSELQPWDLDWIAAQQRRQQQQEAEVSGNGTEVVMQEGLCVADVLHGLAGYLQGTMGITLCRHSTTVSQTTATAAAAAATATATAAATTTTTAAGLNPTTADAYVTATVAGGLSDKATPLKSPMEDLLLQLAGISPMTNGSCSASGSKINNSSSSDVISRATGTDSSSTGNSGSSNSGSSSRRLPELLVYSVHAEGRGQVGSLVVNPLGGFGTRYLTRGSKVEAAMTAADAAAAAAGVPAVGVAAGDRSAFLAAGGRRSTCEAEETNAAQTGMHAGGYEGLPGESAAAAGGGLPLSWVLGSYPVVLVGLNWQQQQASELDGLGATAACLLELMHEMGHALHFLLSTSSGSSGRREPSGSRKNSNDSGHCSTGDSHSQRTVQKLMAGACSSSSKLGSSRTVDDVGIAERELQQQQQQQQQQQALPGTCALQITCADEEQHELQQQAHFSSSAWHNACASTLPIELLELPSLLFEQVAMHPSVLSHLLPANTPASYVEALSRRMRASSYCPVKYQLQVLTMLLDQLLLMRPAKQYNTQYRQPGRRQPDEAPDSMHAVELWCQLCSEFLPGLPPCFGVQQALSLPRVVEARGQVYGYAAAWMLACQVWEETGMAADPLDPEAARKMRRSVLEASPFMPAWQWARQLAADGCSMAQERQGDAGASEDGCSMDDSTGSSSKVEEADIQCGDGLNWKHRAQTHLFMDADLVAKYLHG